MMMTKQKTTSLADRLQMGDEVRELKLGCTFNTKNTTTAFHTIKYDFKPASVDKNRVATVDVGLNNQVTVTVPNLVSSGVPHTVYKGNHRKYTKECLIILDKKTGDITLEKLNHNIQVKKTRSEMTSKLGAAVPPPAAIPGAAIPVTIAHPGPSPAMPLSSAPVATAGGKLENSTMRITSKTKVSTGSRRNNIIDFKPRNSPMQQSGSPSAAPSHKSPQSAPAWHANNAQATLPSIPMIVDDDDETSMFSVAAGALGGSQDYHMPLASSSGTNFTANSIAPTIAGAVPQDGGKPNSKQVKQSQHSNQKRHNNHQRHHQQQQQQLQQQQLHQQQQQEQQLVQQSLQMQQQQVQQWQQQLQQQQQQQREQQQNQQHSGLNPQLNNHNHMYSNAGQLDIATVNGMQAFGNNNYSNHNSNSTGGRISNNSETTELAALGGATASSLPEIGVLSSSSSSSESDSSGSESGSDDSDDSTEDDPPPVASSMVLQQQAHNLMHQLPNLGMAPLASGGSDHLLAAATASPIMQQHHNHHNPGYAAPPAVVNGVSGGAFPNDLLHNDLQLSSNSSDEDDD